MNSKPENIAAEAFKSKQAMEQKIALLTASIFAYIKVQ